MVPPRPRPQFFTPSERDEFQPSPVLPHQKAAVLLLIAKSLEQELSKAYDVTLELRDTGGFTLRADLWPLETREDVKVIGPANP